jgi:epsilon-lactone hydrolase
MSLRAEILRLGTRCLLKGKPGPDVSLAERRRRAAAISRLVPNPPPGIARIAVDAGGVAAEWVLAPASQHDRHILYLHGGGYVIGSPSLYRNLTWRLASAARARVLAIDYRLAPEHPFPAALDDAMAAYEWLLADGADPRRLTVIGDSAGGGLAFSVLLRCRDEGRLPLPAAVVALSPWTDLALTGASLRRNAVADPFVDANGIPPIAEYYLAGADPRHPYASPLYGDPTGLPPALIQVGGDEVLLDDATRMAVRLRASGCEVALEVWPRMPHVWHLFATVMPEARRAIARVGAFTRERAAVTTG